MEQSVGALLGAGQLDEAFTSVSGRIKKHPDDARARESLFTVLCYKGELDRAYDQLQTWARLEPGALTLLIGHEALLAQERQRQVVLRGEQAPVLREPAETDAKLQAEVLRLWCAGQQAQAARHFKERMVVKINGSLDGKSFSGLEDYDSRFGALLEVFLPEGYRLVPFGQVGSIRSEPPKTYLDAIWRPAMIEFADKTVTAYLPCRYPDTESAQDPLVRLGQKTVCEEPYEGFFTAMGQRFWLTRQPSADFQALSFTLLQLESPSATPPTS
jgi:type VI secretion system protein ImpE